MLPVCSSSPSPPLAVAGPRRAALRRATVRGTVKLPDASRSTRLYQGYWRLDNGNVPVQTAGGAKAETVVVLENVKGAHAPSARTVTVELGGLDARPRLVITGPGSVIELKNTGKVRHELSTPDKPDGDAARDAAAGRDPPAALRHASAASSSATASTRTS